MHITLTMQLKMWRKVYYRDNIKGLKIKPCILRKKKQEFWHSITIIFSENKGNRRKIYQGNNIKSKSKEVPTCIQDYNKCIMSTSEISNCFNKYFNIAFFFFYSKDQKLTWNQNNLTELQFVLFNHKSTDKTNFFHWFLNCNC